MKKGEPAKTLTQAIRVKFPELNKTEAKSVAGFVENSVAQALVDGANVGFIKKSRAGITVSELALTQGQETPELFLASAFMSPEPKPKSKPKTKAKK